MIGYLLETKNTDLSNLRETISAFQSQNISFIAIPLFDSLSFGNCLQKDSIDLLYHILEHSTIKSDHLIPDQGWRENVAICLDIITAFKYPCIIEYLAQFLQPLFTLLTLPVTLEDEDRESLDRYLNVISQRISLDYQILLEWRPNYFKSHIPRIFRLAMDLDSIISRGLLDYMNTDGQGGWIDAQDWALCISRDPSNYDLAPLICQKLLHHPPLLLGNNSLASMTKKYPVWSPTKHQVLSLGPLQPLTYNLSSEVYAHFEQDAVKYTKYYEAIRAAFVDFTIRLASQPHDDSKRLRILVIGPGRGPLIDCIIRAARDCPVEIGTILGIEKNPFVVPTLLHRLQLDPDNGGWKGLPVKILRGDARTLYHEKKSIQKFHLIVSELLGSFGDNELAPECLAPAVKHLLCPNIGIMIPQNCESYLQPVHFPVYRNQYPESPENAGPMVISIPDRRMVLRLAHPEPVFQFNFVTPSASFSRQRTITFYINFEDSPIDGFFGYFKAVLYRDIVIGTVPGVCETSGMRSWFPIFFPLSSPFTAGPNNWKSNTATTSLDMISVDSVSVTKSSSYTRETDTTDVDTIKYKNHGSPFEARLPMCGMKMCDENESSKRLLKFDTSLLIGKYDQIRNLSNINYTSKRINFEIRRNCHDDGRVWYSWCLENGVTHNHEGKGQCMYS